MITHTPLKSYRYFLIIAIMVFIIVGYLGFRTIKHEILIKHYQTQELAQSRISNINTFITDTLQNLATLIDTLINNTTINANSLSSLITKNTDIENIFVLEHNKLIYPNPNANQSQQIQQFIKNITPIIYDQQLLYAHSITDEQQVPQSGWYIDYQTQIPLLIYWYQKNSTTIGVQVSYIKLLSDIINQADFDYDNALIKIIENDRILYQSNDTLNIKPHLITSKTLAYPLANWRIEYYGHTAQTMPIYLWGVGFLILLCMVIGLIIYRLYREYTQTAQQALQQVNFVNQVSHELKTPLTNIMLYAELLKEELTDQDYNLPYMDVILTEGQRLTRLINNILTFTKKSKVNNKLFCLSELIYQITHSFTPCFANKKIQVFIAVPENIYINSDADKITQIIYNFLSNVEKYASQGKKIDITVKQQDTFIDICVRDYGCGIPDKEQKLIFNPFYRIKSTITEGVSGTGIGLTIAQQIAQSLQAEIFVNNAKPGACFILRLHQSNNLTEHNDGKEQ